MFKKNTVLGKKPAGKATDKTKKVADVVKAPAKKGTFPARKAGAPARKPRPVINFAPPPDFKPADVEFYFKTAADGLLSPKIAMTRVKGRWVNPEALRFNMIEYDMPTVAAFMSRLQAKLFTSNVDRRLPKNTSYRVVARVASRKPNEKNGLDKEILTVAIRDVAKRVKLTNGKHKWKSFKTDQVKSNPDYAKIRRTRPVLAGAFTDFQLPPSTRRSKKTEEE
jgi:hypothetical protein